MIRTFVGWWLAAAAVWTASVPASWADDWPQWQGPTRNSVWAESGIASSLPAAGPKIAWRAAVAGGYSGPAVANGRVYLTDYVRSAGEAKNEPDGRAKLEGRERVLCLEAASGKLLWKYEYDCPYEISYPAGPRATPTVDGERVYTLGAQGNLLCLNVASGEVLWQLDLKTKYSAPVPIWGFCSHPLVDGDKLFCLAGGEGSVAISLDKLTGREIWRALSAPDAGYCPPTMIQAGGQRQLIIWHPQSVNALEPSTGKVLWTVKLAPDYGMSINPPAQIGDHLFVAGNRNKGVLLRLDQDKAGASEVWRTANDRGMGPVHSPTVPVGNILYGVDRLGELTALEIPSGERLWRTYQATTGARPANSGTAFLVRNADRFYIFNELGELIIARLTPERYEELARAKILEPTHEAFGRNVVWSHPAFAERAMFVRNDKEIVRVSLAQE